MTTPLNLFGTNTTASTIGTAGLLVAGTGASGYGQSTSKCGTSTGYSEMYSQGTTNAWASAGSIGAISGNGWLFDATTLEHQQIIAGNWAPAIRAFVSVGTISLDMYVRVYKYNSGTYSLIGTCSLLSQTMNTTVAPYNFAGTALAAVSFGTGDKLYYDVWFNLANPNNSGSSTATIALTHANSATLGRNNNAELDTPGYIPLARTITTTAALGLTSKRTITATAALELTAKRTITATSALLATKKRTIPATAALLQTSTRTIPATADLGTLRSIPATAALKGTIQHIIPATAGLSLVPTPDASGQFGVTIGFNIANANTLFAYWPQLFADLRRLGCSWIRLNYSWQNIERTPGVYTWTVLDDAVTQINAAGFPLLYCMREPPTWYLSQVADSEPWLMPDPVGMAGWATVLLNRYNNVTILSTGVAGHIDALGYNEDFNIHFTSYSDTITLNQALSAGTPYTSFSVLASANPPSNPAGFTPQVGSLLYFGGYNSADVATISSNVSGTDTIVHVSSFTPQANYAAGATLNIAYIATANSPYSRYNPGPGGVTIAHKAHPARDGRWAAAVMNKVMPAVRAVNPTILVGTPCIWWTGPIDNAYRGSPSNYTAYLQQIYTDAGAVIDQYVFLDFHYYSNAADPATGIPSVSSIGQAVTDIQNVAALNGDAGRAIWNTEYGWQVPIDVDAATQAVNYGVVLAAVMPNGTKNKSFFFTLWYAPTGGTGGSLIYWNGTGYSQRPAYSVLQNFIANFVANNGGGGSGGSGGTTGGTGLVIDEFTQRHYPTDGFYIYDEIAPTSSATYKPRLAQIAAAGFSGVLNYQNLYCSGAQLAGYINDAASYGLKVIVALNEAPLWNGTPDISGTYPAMTTSAGSITGAGVVAYVVNLVKGLPGLWGYYVGESIASGNHTLVKANTDLIHSTDSTHPRLFVDGVLDTVTFSANTSPYYDCCDVGGSSHYPTGSYDGSDGIHAENGLDETADYAAGVQTTATAHGIAPAFVCQAFSYQRYNPPSLCSPYPACAPYPSRYKMREERDLVLANMHARIVLVYSYFDTIPNQSSQSFQDQSNWRDVEWAFEGRHP